MQGKEAQASVLEPFVGRPRGPPGRAGRLRAAPSSSPRATPCWAGRPGLEGGHYYWRQLWDNKGAYDVESLSPIELAEYAGLCGTCLAQAHPARPARP